MAQGPGRFYENGGSLFVEAYDSSHTRDTPQIAGDIDFCPEIAQRLGGPVPELACGTGTSLCRLKLPSIEYGPDCLVRRVQNDGRVSFMDRNVFVSCAFAEQPIGLRPSERDGVFDILFWTFRIGRFDLTAEVRKDK